MQPSEEGTPATALQNQGQSLANMCKMKLSQKTTTSVLRTSCNGESLEEDIAEEAREKRKL